MVRLITLKLQPVLRPVNHPPSPPAPNQPPPTPARSPKRIESTMSSTLTLPQTQTQWRVVLDEVRAIYLRRQYKQCSSRCIKLLEESPNTDLSLYHIYLSFYAAVCLELMARSLPIDFSEKLPLFHLARVYYEKTERHMWEAESGQVVISPDSLGKTSLGLYYRSPSSSSTSSSGSCRSSFSSATDSADWYNSLSPMHSPASSVSSSFSKYGEEPCNLLKPQPLRVKKSVSFYLSSLAVAVSAKKNFTDSNQSVPRVFQSRLDEYSSPITTCYTTATPSANTTTSDTVQSFLISRSFDRCRMHLTILRTQLKHHLSTITELISLIENTQCFPLTRNASHPGRRSKRGNFPTMFDSYKKTLPDILESEAEEKARQRAARIAQLKQRGVDWKLGRGRFDGSKYERLCQEALRELQV